MPCCPFRRSGPPFWIPSAGVTGYKSVAKDSTSLMSAPNRNPVSVALEADQSAFQHYKTWITTSGYDSSAGYFHVKNSWGSTWGDGVWCLSRSECLFYCVSRSLHQCGILPDSSSSMICVVAALNCVAVIRRSNVSEALYSPVELYLGPW